MNNHQKIERQQSGNGVGIGGRVGWEGEPEAGGGMGVE